MDLPRFGSSWPPSHSCGRRGVVSNLKPTFLALNRKNLSGEDTLRGFGQYFINLGYEIAFSPKKEFGQAAINTMMVTVFVMAISLTFGTLGGYALARSTAQYMPFGS